jgi:hypothetical protein
MILDAQAEMTPRGACNGCDGIAVRLGKPG